MPPESPSVDRCIRAVLSRYYPDVAHWILGKRPLEVTELDSALATTASRFADKLLLVRFAGESDVLLHVEFQSRGDPEMPARMAEYLALCLRAIGRLAPRVVRPACVVVYLDREGHRHDPGALDIDGPIGLRFSMRYKVIKLWEEDPAPLLALPSPALTPLVPLMAGSPEALLVQSREKILAAPEAIAGAESKRELLTVLAALSAKAVRHSPILDRLLTEIRLMGDNWVLDLLSQEGHARGLAEGRAQGQALGRNEGQRLAVRQAVLRVLRRRFADVPEAVSSRLDGIDSLEALGILLEDAAVAPDLSAFLARLDR